MSVTYMRAEIPVIAYSLARIFFFFTKDRPISGNELLKTVDEKYNFSKICFYLRLLYNTSSPIPI